MSTLLYNFAVFYPLVGITVNKYINSSFCVLFPVLDLLSYCQGGKIEGMRKIKKCI